MVNREWQKYSGMHKKGVNVDIEKNLNFEQEIKSKEVFLPWLPVSLSPLIFHKKMQEGTY